MGIVIKSVNSSIKYFNLIKAQFADIVKPINK